MDMDKDIIISLRHVCKEYPDGEKTIKALDDVNLDVHKGEFISVTGESGSGKSTLLNVIGSIDTPTDGMIIVNGSDITNKNDRELSAFRRRNVGFIFQNYNLIPVLNAEENILLPLGLDNTPPDKAFLEELLDLTGLQSRRYRFPHELSGGQQQRIAFVRALIHKPQIILADEPTGNLDTKNSREIISILKTSVQKYNQALILITHDQAIAAQADAVYIMDDGLLSKSGVRS